VNGADYEDLVENHVQAFLALIKVDEEFQQFTFEGDVNGNPERYTNVFHTPGFFEGHTLGNELVDVTVTFTVHNVGLDRWQAQWGAGRVLARVLGVTPQIDGRRCWRIEHQPGPPIAKDETATPVRFLAIDRYFLKSTPA
jgi:hypothetical protein